MSPAHPRAGRRQDAALPDLSRYGALAEYNRKRHFGVTPEPPGEGRTADGGPRPLEFVVQKHRATRLHYDFRLEHRGVMLSWAVPKGPSLDPAVKRLAMETEPHPIDYNQFEGVIPEGEYGGGTVMIWDRGVWAPVAEGRLGAESDVDRQLARGELKFVILGQKLAGSWTLVRTRGERQWLMIKHRDEHASSEDLTVTRPWSVVSDRSMADIARAAGGTPRQVAQAAGTDPADVPATAHRSAAATAGRPGLASSRPASAASRRAPATSRPAPAAPRQASASSRTVPAASRLRPATARPGAAATKSTPAATRPAPAPRRRAVPRARTRRRPV